MVVIAVLVVLLVVLVRRRRNRERAASQALTSVLGNPPGEHGRWSVGSRWL